MMKYGGLAILIFCVSCSLPARKPAPTPSTPGQKSPSTQLPFVEATKPPADLRESEVLAIASDFRPALIEWLRKNGRAKHSRLAKEAQKLIGQHGLLFLVNIKDLADRDDRYQMLPISGGRTLVFDTSNGIEGPCGEFYVYVSVVDLKGGAPVVLTNHGPIQLEKNTTGLYFEQTIVRESEGAEKKSFLLPAPDGPWGVGNKADYIVWKYDLNMSLMENWWRGLTRRYRDLRDERPFIAVRISDDGFTVEQSDKGLLPGFYEQVESQSPGVVRRSYKPRGVLVDVSSSCH